MTVRCVLVATRATPAKRSLHTHVRADFAERLLRLQPREDDVDRRAGGVERGCPLALRPAEAAEALSVSPDFFAEHVLLELRVVRRGRLVLIAVRELERWLEESSERTLRERRVRW